MAVLQDPQGAYFEVWQPGAHFGAALVNAPGAFVWNELATPDLDAASAFYSGLFGWTIEDAPGMDPRYLSIMNGGANNGGMREPMPPDVPPHWLVYFGVEDIDAGLAKAVELGGVQLAGPHRHRGSRSSGSSRIPRARPSRSTRASSRPERRAPSGATRASGCRRRCGPFGEVGAGRRRHHRGGAAAKRAPDEPGGHDAQHGRERVRAWHVAFGTAADAGFVDCLGGPLGRGDDPARHGWPSARTGEPLCRDEAREDSPTCTPLACSSARSASDQPARANFDAL